MPCHGRQFIERKGSGKLHISPMMAYLFCERRGTELRSLCSVPLLNKLMISTRCNASKAEICSSFSRSFTKQYRMRHLLNTPGDDDAIISPTNRPLYPLPRNLHSYPMIRFAQPSNIPNRAAFYSSSLPIAIVEVFRPSRLFSLPEWLSNRPPRPLC